jgi:deoxyribose-phosphate aldolase
MNAEQLAARIDHTLLKPEATPAEIDVVVEEARQHRFASVCVAPVYVKRVAEALRGSGVKTCTVAGFPAGTSKPTVKAIEAVAAIKDGADEIDVVAHLPLLLSLDLDAARAELMEIVRGARSARNDVIIKVIVESAVLMKLNAGRAEETIALACRAVRESGCDFIKTSTGMHPLGGATLDAVRLMKKHGAEIRVKAAGGIRDLATATAMLDAGADRLGLSAGVAIVKELLGEKPATPASGY